MSKLTIAVAAAAKGFRLHRCIPLTGATPECWMVQRGASARFFESLEGLRAAVADMDEYRPVNPMAAAEEDALRAALAELNVSAI